MGDYEKSLDFWDHSFLGAKEEKVTSKFVESLEFNQALTDHVNKDSTVLDFGCGSGWGLLEMYLTSPFSTGLGLDPSSNSIAFANKTATLSLGYKNPLIYKQGNQDFLADYPECFDFFLSVNTIDVCKDEVGLAILKGLQSSLKKGSYGLIMLNPEFTKAELNKLGFTENNGAFYKNGIYRLNCKTHEEWKKEISSFFTIDKSAFITLFHKENFKRQFFLVKKA